MHPTRHRHLPTCFVGVLILAGVLVLASCSGSGSHSDERAQPGPGWYLSRQDSDANDIQRYATGNVDFDRMLSLSITIAREILGQDNTFVPFATAVRTDGELAAVLAFEPMLTTAEAVDRTIAELVRGVGTGVYRSTAIVTDVIAPVGRTPRKSDAISVLLEDEQWSRNFILPYRRVSGRVEFGSAYFRAEESLVFRPEVSL